MVAVALILRQMPLFPQRTIRGTDRDGAKPLAK